MLNKNGQSLSAKAWLLIALAFAACVAIFDYSFLGLFQKAQGDTLSYTVTAQYFYDRQMPTDPVLNHYVRARLLKPTYGVIGALLMPVMNAEQSMLLLNIFFYFGCAFLLFKILSSLLDFKPWQAFIGVAWFACSYPMLKYGFALMTDIGGYFFALLSIFFALLSDKRQKAAYLFWAGVASAIGFAVKETGGLGMLFIFFYWLLRIKEMGVKKLIRDWAYVGLPFLSISLAIQLAVTGISGYSYADWVGSAEEALGEQFRTVRYFVGTQGAAFHLLWIFFLVGLIKIKKFSDPKALLALIPAGLPVLAWPIFITRILFFQFIFVIPLALHGFCQIIESIKKPALKKALVIILPTLPCLISLALFLIARQGSLFKS